MAQPMEKKYWVSQMDEMTAEQISQALDGH
jgi:hypothetical protein